MSLPYLRSIVLAAAATAIALPANAALQARDLDKNGVIDAYYDTALNVTWLANANLMASNSFGLSYGINYGKDAYLDRSVIYNNGTSTWGGAEKWISAMNASNYFGFSDWRLPTVAPINGNAFIYNGTSYNGRNDVGYNISAPGTLYAGSKGSEMAYLFYNELGYKAYQDPVTGNYLQGGFGVTNNGPFLNLQNSHYWSNTGWSDQFGRPYWAWYFDTGIGYQSTDAKNYATTTADYALVVRTGDVLAAVPEPETYGMMLAGLGMIGLIARRRKQI
jgi:hypothetical protein